MLCPAERRANSFGEKKPSKQVGDIFVLPNRTQQIQGIGRDKDINTAKTDPTFFSREKRRSSLSMKKKSMPRPPATTK